MHFCGVCGEPVTTHKQPDRGMNYLCPPCCKGCPCGSYEEWVKDMKRDSKRKVKAKRAAAYGGKE
jgi:hypothetical protein